MDLVTPDLGLLFWTGLVFILLMFLLVKFAWKPILSAVDERNKSIEDALKAADKAKEAMALLNSDNEKILAAARQERDVLLKEAREMKDKIVNEAKEQAITEADKISLSAKEQINNEKLKAITELKNQVAKISIDIAEKILKSELSDKNKQQKFKELKKNYGAECFPKK